MVLEILDLQVRIEAPDRPSLAEVEAVYGHMRRGLGHEVSPALQLGGDVELSFQADREDALWQLDGDLVVELQKRRSDLYFLHGAVVEHGSRAYALVAESGGGKSSLCWALLHAGCAYVSDELCPVDLGALQVQPFPRAPSLKWSPGAGLRLPDRVLRTSRAIYIPTSELPAEVVSRPLPLRGLFFLRYDPSASAPVLRPISTAEAATRVYVNALNALAHPEDGLDGAIRIASACDCFELSGAELVATSRLVLETLEKLADQSEDGDLGRTSEVAMGQMPAE